jgi:hypothetical protein
MKSNVTERSGAIDRHIRFFFKEEMPEITPEVEGAMWASLFSAGVIEKSEVDADAEGWRDLVLYRLLYMQVIHEATDKALKGFKKRMIAAGHMVDNGNGSVTLIDHPDGSIWKG